jgi:hypothetical protein
MTAEELPIDLRAEDRVQVASELAEMREHDKVNGALALYLSDAKQLLMIVLRDGDIVSWCLMPARDHNGAQALATRLKRILAHEVESIWRDVKELADVAIGRASRKP